MQPLTPRTRFWAWMAGLAIADAALTVVYAASSGVHPDPAARWLLAASVVTGAACVWLARGSPGWLVPGIVLQAVPWVPDWPAVLASLAGLAVVAAVVAQAVLALAYVLGAGSRREAPA